MRPLFIRDSVGDKRWKNQEKHLKIASRKFRLMDLPSFLPRDTPSYRDARTHLKSRMNALKDQPTKQPTDTASYRRALAYVERNKRDSFSFPTSHVIDNIGFLKSDAQILSLLLYSEVKWKWAKFNKKHGSDTPTQPLIGVLWKKQKETERLVFIAHFPRHWQYWSLKIRCTNFIFTSIFLCKMKMSEIQQKALNRHTDTAVYRRALEEAERNRETHFHIPLPTSLTILVS